MNRAMFDQIANNQNSRGLSKRMRNECEQIAAWTNSRADIKAGRFVKASPADHVKRVKKMNDENHATNRDRHTARGLGIVVDAGAESLEIK